MSHHPAYTIGGLCAVGGTAAFISKRSKPSLIAGVTTGLLFIYSGYLIQENRNYGHELAFGKIIHFLLK